MNSKDSVKKEKKHKKRRNPFRFFVYDFVKVTGAISSWLWLRPKMLFESKKAKKHVRGGAVAIANHTHIRDPIAMYFAFWYRRVSILALKEIFTTKLGDWFFRHVLCIPVDRENFNMQTFRSAADILDDGRVLGVFPEGHINADKSSVQSFKSGAVLMAIKARVPIVPVYIEPYAKWYRRTVIVMGEPIDPQLIFGGAPNLRDMEKLSQMLREKEIQLKEICNAWRKK